MSIDSLLWLQRWYQAQCDGVWEHARGVKIDTLDNPGWSVTVDVDLQSIPEPIAIERSENDWLRCEMDGGQFKGFGGPENLVELLTILRSWLEGEGPRTA